VITTNAEGHIQEMNPSAEKLTRCQRQEAIGLSISTVFKPLDENSQQLIPNPVDIVLNTRKPVYSKKTTLLCHPDQCWDIQYSVSPIFGDQQTLMGAILVFRDVTQQQVLLRQIHWQASHDALTGLMNRREFEVKLSEWIHQTIAQAQDKSAILIFLDLDRFKAVNDTCGHFAGDELLRQVGDLLHQCLREDDVLARLGGDEFGILLPECDLTTGKQVAERIYQVIQDYRFCWQDYQFTIGVSIGVTLVTGDRTASDILQQADSACYLAKHQGRNQICLAEQLTSPHPAHQSIQLVHRITEALTHSHFQLFHQNIFAAQPESTALLLGSEILLRLPQAPQDWILPDTFLPTAERYNLMTEIDAWVVQKFCDCYDLIHQQTQTNFYCINLSGASLNSDRLIALIRKQFEAKNILPQSVCIEITETVAIANLTRARALLQELKAWGCSLALDDFGSGMSSFQYLRSLPIDYLKIDGNLIRDIHHDRVAREMVTAIIKIGHEMHIKTIAEWVENAAVLQLLKKLKIDYIQGFFLHVPEAFEIS
jgi:diguanylate cyclase (GGDEF)-like protein/PAS domain S-box-containing protein